MSGRIPKTVFTTIFAKNGKVFQSYFFFVFYPTKSVDIADKGLEKYNMLRPFHHMDSEPSRKWSREEIRTLKSALMQFDARPLIRN